MLSHDQNMYSETVFICAQLSTQLGGKKLPARESALHHHRKEIHWNTGAREGTFSSAQAKPVGQRGPSGCIRIAVPWWTVMSIFTPMITFDSPPWVSEAGLTGRRRAKGCPNFATPIALVGHPTTLTFRLISQANNSVIRSRRGGS
jgi:hypothetical protein